MGGGAAEFFYSQLDWRWFTSMGVDERDNQDYYQYIAGFYLYIRLFSSHVRHKANMTFTTTLFQRNFFLSLAYPWFFGGVVAPGCLGASEGYAAYANFKSEMVRYILSFDHTNIFLQSCLLLPTRKIPQMCQKNP